MEPYNLTEKIVADCKTSQPITHQTVKILANSIFQSLREEGCQNKDIIGISSQLIGLVASAIDSKQD